ncbi:MAG TPA: NAD(P)/FAD-dependent oxidoreductase [Kofleriaceae bacterium]|nr:NAD(P)/FAD-dependent oxidoreductase [Kofleriaceae bacterium]
MTEVAIIGGGMAGLAAARVLVDHDVDVELFEATDRVGGRAHSEREPDTTIAIELGPEFVHGEPRSTCRLAHEAGIRLDLIEQEHHVSDHGQLVRAPDLWSRFGALLCDVPYRDESARAYLDHEPMSDQDRALFASLVEGFFAAPLDDISIASVAADASGPGEPPARQYHVHGGYGRMVDFLAARAAAGGATIHHGCFVEAIDWASRPIRIAYRTGGRVDGFATADRVIVTLPVGVLPDVRFDPGLGDHELALRQIAMGQVVKLVLCLREPVLGDHLARRLDFVHASSGAFPTYWLASQEDRHQLTAWAGGPHARALAGQPAEALAERAIDGFAEAIGVPRAKVAGAVMHHHFHDFDADPCFRGAYSYTRAGGIRAAEQLARPLHDRLYFAGEATDPDYEGTVAGALASGARAARQVLRALRYRA